MEKVYYVQSVNSLQNYLRDVFVETEIYEPTVTDKIIIPAKHYMLSKKAFQILYEAVKPITFCEIPEVTLSFAL